MQNVELKYCSRAAVRCAAGTVGAVKVCARTPGVCSCGLLNFYSLRWGTGLTLYAPLHIVTAVVAGIIAVLFVSVLGSQYGFSISSVRAHR